MYTDIIHDTHYHGLPLSPNHGPYLEHRLADALATVDGIMQESHRIAVQIVEILDGSTLDPLGSARSEKCVKAFVKRLQHYARWKHTDLYKKKLHRKKPVVDAIWQKHATNNGRAWYKVALLLSWEAYYEQSIGFDPTETLRWRARKAWAKIQTIPDVQSGQFIRFPNNGLILANNTARGLCEVFPKLSELCTVPDPQHGQGFILFGSTRKAR